MYKFDRIALLYILWCFGHFVNVLYRKFLCCTISLSKYVHIEVFSCGLHLNKYSYVSNKMSMASRALECDVFVTVISE